MKVYTLKLAEYGIDLCNEAYFVIVAENELQAEEKSKELMNIYGMDFLNMKEIDTTKSSAITLIVKYDC